MKIKKIFAGMAASAIALSMMAITASAYTAGVCFQTNDTWNYRNVPSEGAEPRFPATYVGVQGGAYGYGSVDVGDTSIDKDGPYSVSIGMSGEITEANPNVSGDDDKFTINAEKGLTRINSPWSMLYNYDPKETDESEEVTQDTIEWVQSKETSKFNLLAVMTDIPCEYNDDDKPIVDGQEIKFTNVNVDFGDGQSFPVSDDEVYYKSDEDYVCMTLINAYAESMIDAKALPSSDSGTITISFNIEGLDKKEDDNGGSGDNGSNNNNNNNNSSSASDTSSSAADTSSAAADSSSAAADSVDAGTTDTANASDSSSKAADSSSSSSTAAASASSSTASSSTAAASTTTTTTTTTTTGGSTTASSSTAAAAAAEDDKASDATENAKAGVPAGLALGFIALAGAVAVVAKKR